MNDTSAISYQKLVSDVSTLLLDNRDAMARGYASVVDAMLDAMYKYMLAVRNDDDNSVCTSVSMATSPDSVFVSETFTVTLSLENHMASDVTNVSYVLDHNYANMFNISASKVSIPGNKIPSGQIMSISWDLVPLPAAAQCNNFYLLLLILDSSYSIGANVTWVINGQLKKATVFPTTVTIMQTPDIRFHYLVPKQLIG